MIDESHINRIVINAIQAEINSAIIQHEEPMPLKGITLPRHLPEDSLQDYREWAKDATCLIHWFDGNGITTMAYREWDGETQFKTANDLDDWRPISLMIRVARQNAQDVETAKAGRWTGPLQPDSHQLSAGQIIDTAHGKFPTS